MNNFYYPGVSTRVAVNAGAKRLPNTSRVSLGDKGAVPLTFSQMPCVTTSKSCGESVCPVSCFEKPLFFRPSFPPFPFKRQPQSDKPESSLDNLASQTQALRNTPTPSHPAPTLVQTGPAKCLPECFNCGITRFNRQTAI